MNAAVLPAYAYNGGPSESSPIASTFVGAGHARMTKRRRLKSGDAGGGEYPRNGGWEQHQESAVPSSSEQQQHNHYAAHLSAAPFGGSSGNTVEYVGGAVPASTQNSTTGAASTLNESSDLSNAHWHSSATSPYPDVASYSQQPYFYQQTDPNTYNSPWPPADAASFGGTQASNYSVPAPSAVGAMPFFPGTTRAEPEEGYDTANSQSSFQQSHPQEIEPLPQYAYVQQSVSGPSRSDMPGSSSHLYFDDASMHVKVQSLPILDNLASQLIHTIAKANFPQIQEIMRGTDTEDSQAYTTLKNLFDQTRKVYSRETPFIDAIAIQMFQPNQQEIIRKANVATFISSILGAHDVSFFHLNEFFMETFVPLGHRLLKWQGAIYLELKTQTYISALMNSEGGPEAMLDELFPPDLDAQILTRHPDAPSLSPSEQDFIDRSRARKSYLLAENSAEEALRELPKKYQWHDFVREFASCINKNVDGIMHVPVRAQQIFGSSAADRRSASAAQAIQDALDRNNQLSLAGVSGASALPGVQSLSLNGQGGRSGIGGQGDSNDASRKSNAAASTSRQPWTKPEEDALLSGLERVNGPHWSQILALYGRGGSISEVLKDRNQVQLKDKARNLKLWHLKMGKDVPPALRGVTGELRKRGGARARAALGVADEDDENIDAEMEVDAIDPRFERSKGKSSKKKTKKGS